ncbi:MAG: PAS domain S-box protein [Maribacter sp.]
MAVKLKEKGLFQSIFESSVEGILVVDTSGMLLSTNQAAEQMFGYGPGELVNENLKILIPKQFRKKHISHREEYTNNPKPRPMGENLALFGLKKNGSKFPVKVSLSPATVKGQSITIAFVSDASKLKSVEQELKARNAKDKALLEAIPDMIVIQNYAGDIIDIHKPEHINVPEHIGFQLPREEVIGKNIADLVPPEMSKKILKAHNKAIKTNQIQVREYALNEINGIIDIEARTVRLNDHNLLTIIRDITERKRVEQELKESEAKNSAILNALPDTIIIHDKEGNFLDVLAAEPSSLFSKEEVIGKNIKDIFPSDKSREIINILAKTHETKSLQVLKIAVPGKESTVYAEGLITPFEDDKLLVVLRDITESKAVEDILYVRNRALEAAGNGIIIADAQQPNRPIIYTNDAFSHITGYGKSEVLGKNCRFLQNGDRDQKEIGIIRKAIKDGQPCHEVLRNYKKDGTLFWNELTITPLYNDQGSLTHFIGVQSDVTQSKKAEFLKDQIRKILELIAQHWPLDFIANTIVETVEQHIENCLASILLLDREKGTLHNLSAPNLPKSLTQALEGLNIGPNICSCCSAVHLKKELLTTDLTKDPLWKEHRNLLVKHNLKSSWSLPILSSSQEVLGVLVLYYQHPIKPGKSQREMIEDINFLCSVAIEQHETRITLHENRKQLSKYAHELEEQVEERTNELKSTVQKLVETNLNLEDQVLDTKAAENRAMASQTMFTAIARNFPKGVIIVFNTDYDIVYIDGGELQRMGLNKTEFEGINVDDTGIFSQKRIEQIKENINKTMEGEHLSFEIQFRRRSYSVNTTPLYDDNNKIKWTLFVYNDITKQKQAERNIRSALVREQELNELKSRFIAMASHEFRTPLSAILSSAILIGKQNEPGKEVKREKYIGQITTNVRNLVVILNDFLSLSKLEEGKVTVRREKFDIVQFSKSLVEEIDSSKKYGQKIAIKHKKPAINAFLDPKLTRHILTNLISNAIKYSQENKDIDLILDKNQKNVVIKIIDQGIGIPKEEQPNLFQRFFRAENSAIIQGTGLGLHIVKQYTELMGGQVSFQSELNKGATFIVELPIV